MRMIDKEELLNIFLKWRKIDIELHGKELEWEPSLVLRAVNEAPEVDAVPVVRGEWIQHHETTTDNETLPYGWECSLCGRWAMEKQPFCNCGARMEDKPCG